MLKTTPAVFIVGDSYQIMVENNKESLFSVRIGNKTYYDESNGIMNSLSPLHRVTVPVCELNKANEYTICIRPIIKRKPYFTETEEIFEQTFKFHPVPENNIRAYHISDAHNRIEEPVNAVKTFGKIDFLILNGDIIDHSGDYTKFANIYKICSLITNGNIPVVFSRGNHDMRGNFAEKFAEFTPNHNGNTYYSFRLGSLWGLVLDCGEDKEDDCDEYGFTVACHAFRERQTEFIENLINNSQNEFMSTQVKHKIVIAHNPFTQKHEPPFDIEPEIFTKWCSLLREKIKPNLMICGHTHELEIRKAGCEKDSYGQPCPVVISSIPDENYFAGCGFEFKDNSIEVVFTDSNGKILSKGIIQDKDI